MESAMSVSNLYRVAEIELVYKCSVKASERPKIKNSQDAYRILLQSWNPDKIEFVEQFKIMFLDRSNKVLGIYEVSTGGLTGTIADPKLIFTAALKGKANSIILAHNHPSGNCKPSFQDKELTRKVKLIGDILDIKVCDHIIVTSEEYCSFADEGLI